jgi:hypothetical protein
LGLKDLFGKRNRDEVVGTKVLLASLDPKFADILKSDANSYAQFYPATTTLDLVSFQQLLEEIGKG